MQLFDTHAHLEAEQFSGKLEALFAASADAGLVGITAIGTTLASSQRCVDLAEREQANTTWPQVYAAVGIHPNDSHKATEHDWSGIVKLAEHPRVVAIGETGLDRYWDDAPFETQERWLARHIELSFNTGKPLVLHMRDCEADMLRMLNEHQRDGRIIGILHSFTGEWATAARCLELGMFISFAGMLTYKKSHDLREVAAKIPDDRLLIETDSPYLSPHPHRSVRPNQPHLVQHTAACLAEVRGCSVKTIAELTTRNAHTVFGLSGEGVLSV